MGYYAGGYYAGGYYAGGLFSGIGKALGGIARVGFGALTGGPLGGAKAAIAVAKENTTAATLAAGGDASALTPALKAKHAAAVARGGAGGGAPIHPSMAPPGMITAPMAMAAMGMSGMRGMHLNRSTYAVRGGGTSHYPPGLNLVVKGTSLVRNRTMNWGNGKALARAERRIGSFLNHATKYLRWAHPGKAGHAVPKFPKRKRKR